MPLLYLNTRECRWYLMGEGEMKKIAAISLISVFLMSGCAVHNDETSIGKFGLAYKSNIQRKLDNQYYTEAEASLARGRISGAENIVKNDAAHFHARKPVSAEKKHRCKRIAGKSLCSYDTSSGRKADRIADRSAGGYPHRRRRSAIQPAD